MSIGANLSVKLLRCVTEALRFSIGSENVTQMQYKRLKIWKLIYKYDANLLLLFAQEPFV